MPYIKKELRGYLGHAVRTLAGLIHRRPDTGRAGMVNYAISYLVSLLIREQGCSYALLNELIGALECAKLELYRRLVVEHEEEKIKQNGDIFNEETTD